MVRLMTNDYVRVVVPVGPANLSTMYGPVQSLHLVRMRWTDVRDVLGTRHVRVPVVGVG
jgi:hypothetical protein